MAKRDNSLAISFFSFQDIITSITGIMFLVVLMLVLLIITRQAPTSPESKKVEENVEQLRQRLAELQELVAANVAQSKNLRQRIDELKKLNPETLPARKEELLKKMELIAASTSRSKNSQRELEAEVRAAKEQLKQLTDAKSKVAEQRAKLEALLKKSNDEKSKNEQILAKNSKLVHFVWEETISKKPLLATCSEKKIVVTEAKSGKELMQVESSSVPALMTEEFLSKCKTFNTNEVYFVLLAKPSSFEYANDLTYELSQLGFSRGVEVLPSEDYDIQGGK